MSPFLGPSYAGQATGSPKKPVAVKERQASGRYKILKDTFNFQDETTLYMTDTGLHGN
jgi:hypothetical protein